MVGESHYQEALRRAAGGRAAGDDFDQHLEVEAALVPEPENPHDKYAVRVDVVLHGKMLTVGYLAREFAPDYQRELLQLRNRGLVGTCPARITGGGGRYYGIYLHVCSARDLKCLNRTGDIDIASVSGQAGILAADWSCTVTKEDAHQDVLRQYVSTGITNSGRVVACLGYCEISNGKYAGEQAIEVRLNGRRVGELTYAMTTRYRAIVDRVLNRGLVPSCEAVVTNTAKGLQLELLMPRTRAS